MGYHYTQFGDTFLPIANPQQQHDPMPADSTILESIGGAVDYARGVQAVGRRQQFNLTGYYVGEYSFFSDDGDESGGDEDALVWGNGPTMLRADLDGLREKTGTTDRIWRKRLDDGALQWKDARLLAVQHPQVVKDRDYLAQITCQFETLHAAWHSETVTERSIALASNGFIYAYVLEVDSGTTVRDATLTITRGSGTLTSITIYCPTLGIHLLFTGLATSSGSIIIDNGNQTMRHSAAGDVYSFFTRGAEHTARGWLPLPPGHHLFYLTVTGGTATATFSYYGQYL